MPINHTWVSTITVQPRKASSLEYFKPISTRQDLVYLQHWSPSGRKLTPWFVIRSFLMLYTDDTACLAVWLKLWQRLWEPREQADLMLTWPNLLAVLNSLGFVTIVCIIICTMSHVPSFMKTKTKSVFSVSSGTDLSSVKCVQILYKSIGGLHSRLTNENA